MATTINGDTGVSQIQDDTVTTAKVDDSQITNALMADDAIGVAELSATGTASSSTFLRGDNAWAAPSGGGVTHLGTLTTTSGTSQALAAQNFSLYNQIWIITDNVSSGGSADFQVGLNGDTVINASGAIPAVYSMWGWFTFDLRTNTFINTYFVNSSATSGSYTIDAISMTGGYYNLTTNYRAVTSGAITIAMEGQTFDAGSAEIYGVS